MRSFGLVALTIAVYVAKSRQLPFGTPVEPPDEETAARSFEPADTSIELTDADAARISNRPLDSIWSTPTVTNGTPTRWPRYRMVSGNATSRSGAICSTKARRWASVGGTER